MKAVFLGDNDVIFNVYDEDLRRELAGVVELYPELIRGDGLERHAAVLRGADVAFSTWGMLPLTRQEIHSYLPRLKAVFYGAGTVQYFARPFLAAGVRVCSAWAANAVPVVELCTSLILLSLKGFFPAHRLAREDWRQARRVVDDHPGIYGATVGLLGLGMTGRGVARHLRDWRCDIEVVGYDPFAPEAVFEELGVRRCGTIGEVFSQSDVVSNHIANLPATREILRYEHFSLLGERGVFLNTGRNAQVHVPGLVRAFTEVPTRTAYFDVTDPDEPPSADNPLLALPNAYFTPHMAGTTGREVRRMGRYMADECERFVAGEPLRWEVSEKMLETMA